MLVLPEVLSVVIVFHGRKMAKHLACVFSKKFQPPRKGYDKSARSCLTSKFHCYRGFSEWGKYITHSFSLSLFYVNTLRWFPNDE